MPQAAVLLLAVVLCGGSSLLRTTANASSTSGSGAASPTELWECGYGYYRSSASTDCVRCSALCATCFGMDTNCTACHTTGQTELRETPSVGPYTHTCMEPQPSFGFAQMSLTSDDPVIVQHTIILLVCMGLLILPFPIILLVVCCKRMKRKRRQRAEQEQRRRERHGKKKINSTLDFQKNIEFLFAALVFAWIEQQRRENIPGYAETYHAHSRPMSEGADNVSVSITINDDNNHDDSASDWRYAYRDSSLARVYRFVEADGTATEMVEMDTFVAPTDAPEENLENPQAVRRPPRVHFQIPDAASARPSRRATVIADPLRDYFADREAGQKIYSQPEPEDGQDSYNEVYGGRGRGNKYIKLGELDRDLDALSDLDANEEYGRGDLESAAFFPSSSRARDKKRQQNRRSRRR